MPKPQQPALRYALTDSPVGRVLLAATDRGLCYLSLGDTVKGLEADLRAAFPGAAVRRADDELKEWAERVRRHLAGELPDPAVPLDARGTAFQRRVWDALVAIPYGETRSYKQVAEAIGAPTAARAVARACATNPVGVLVPCHRVIGSDGKLTGYAGGLPRKEQLLARERAHAPRAAAVTRRAP